MILKSLKTPTLWLGAVRILSKIAKSPNMPPNMAAQIIVVFEFIKLDYKNSKDLKFLILQLGTVRVLSGTSRYKSWAPMRLLKYSLFSSYDVFFFKKLSDALNLKIFVNIWNSQHYLGAVRLLPGVANLTSNYDCSNFYSLRDVICDYLWKVQFSYKVLKFPILKLELSESSRAAADHPSKFNFSNFLSFRDMTVFAIFSTKFQLT